MKKSKYRILSNGAKYKIQGQRSFWVFKYWSDVGETLPPFTPGSWRCSYFDTKEDAQKLIDSWEEKEAIIHEWRLI